VNKEETAKRNIFLGRRYRLFCADSVC